MIKRIATLLLGIGLIGLGIMFFLTPQSSVAVGILMRYWPLFLVLAGIVRVAGFLIDHHPRSPVGGMMIAALGGILFSANLLGHASFPLLLGKYWFWLLLAYIAGRVMKQYLHRAEDGAPAPRAFSPGAIAVMLLIAGGGLAANYFVKSGQQLNFRIASFQEWSLFGHTISVEDEPPQSFALQSGGQLILNNINGDIEINAAPQSQSTARIVKRIHAASEEDAREAAKKIHLQIASNGGATQFTVNASGIEQEYGVAILLTLPQNTTASIAISDALGAVKLTGLRGNATIQNIEDVEIKQNTGRVAIENPRGEIAIRENQGEVSLLHSRRNVDLANIHGAITLDAQGGQVTITDSTGPVKGKLSGGRIEVREIAGNRATENLILLEDVRNSRVNLSGIHGSVSIAADRSRIEAEDIDGNLAITNSNERVIANRVNGALRVTVENGAVEMEELNGPATIEASRDVRVHNFRGPLQINSQTGAINIETGQKLTGDLKATTEDGRIRLTIPQDADFRLDAAAARGRVRLDGFDQITLQRKDRSALLGFNLSDAAPLVSLRSGRGDIQLQSSGLALASREDEPERK